MTSETCESIGQRLSRQLTRVPDAASLDVLPLDHLLRRLFEMTDENAEIGIGHPTELGTSEVRAALAAGRVFAYVEHPHDGRFYQIPACYWGSFHDYRPLASGRFCTGQEHGEKALQLHEGRVFLDKQQVEEEWPVLSDIIAVKSAISEPLVKKNPGPARNVIIVQAQNKVRESVLRAGYVRPLQFGQYQSIKDQLENEISDLSHNTETRSDRSLRKYAKEIEATLPDGSEETIRP